MMNRRAFFGSLAFGSLALLAAPLPAEAQPAKKIARIAMLRSEHRPIDDSAPVCDDPSDRDSDS